MDKPWRFRVFSQRLSLAKSALFVAVLAVLLSLFGYALVLPAAAVFACVYILCALYSAGWAAALLCAALAVGYAFMHAGALGGLLLCLAIFPALAAGVICVEREKPFFFSVALGFAAFFLSGALVLGVALGVYGAQVGDMLCARAEALLRSSSRMDEILSYGYRTGLLPVSADIKVPALLAPASLALPGGVSAGGGTQIILNPQARDELLRALLLRLKIFWCTVVPGQFPCSALAGSVLMQYFARRRLRRRGTNAPLPALHKCFIPAGWGKWIVLPVFLAFMWTYMGGSAQACVFTYTSGAYIAFKAFYDMAAFLFMIQGLAVIDYALFRTGKQRMTRMIVCALAMAVFGSVVSLVGVVDQAMDVRGLRLPPDEEDQDKQEDDF